MSLYAGTSNVKPDGGSCLSDDCFKHFEQRAQQLQNFGHELDVRREAALAAARDAVVGKEDGRPEEDGPSLLGASALDEPECGGQESGQELDVSSRLKPKASSADAVPAGDRIRRPPQERAPPIAELETQAADVQSLHNLIRYQKTHIAKLVEELSQAVRENEAARGQHDAAARELRTVGGELQKVTKIAKNNENVLVKRDATVKALEERVAELQATLKGEAEEKDSWRKKCGKAEQDAASANRRLQSVLADLDRARAEVKQHRSIVREKQVSERSDTQRLEADNARLQSQKAQLVSAFNKQMKLIDVLKRQRTHLEAARLMGFTEAEFERLVDLGDTAVA